MDFGDDAGQPTSETKTCSARVLRLRRRSSCCRAGRASPKAESRRIRMPWGRAACPHPAGSGGLALIPREGRGPVADTGQGNTLGLGSQHHLSSKRAKQDANHVLAASQVDQLFKLGCIPSRLHQVRIDWKQPARGSPADRQEGCLAWGEDLCVCDVKEDKRTMANRRICCSMCVCRCLL